MACGCSKKKSTRYSAGNENPSSRYAFLTPVQLSEKKKWEEEQAKKKEQGE